MPDFWRKAWLLPLVALAAQPALAQVQAAPDAAPEAAAAREAAWAQDYAPRPAIWRVADEDTQIYLLGTVHMLPPGFRWRSPAIDRLVAEADELVVEITEAEMEQDVASFLLFLRDAPAPLLERVPEDKRAELAALIAKSGLPPEAYAPMQTWAAAIMLGMAALLGEYGIEDPAGAPGVEEALEADFRAADKPIRSIENANAVLRSMNAIPEEDQVALLLTGLEEMAEPMLGDAAADDHAWARGRPEELDDIAEGMPESFREALLTRRNAAWAGWLEERLARPGTVLVAVGAGHLSGAGSVQEMLEKRGLEAERFD